MNIRAGRLVSDAATRRLVADPRPGILTITAVDAGTATLHHASTGGSADTLELFLACGDASFHPVPQSPSGQVIGIKLASSGSKFFFWLQDAHADAASLTAELTALLQDGPPPSPEPPAAKPAASRLAGLHLPESLARAFQARPAPSVTPEQVLGVDRVMDAIGPEDLKALAAFFPPGYPASKTSLRTLVASPYFAQASQVLQHIMASESAPTFLAQFGLLEHAAGDAPAGFPALIRALQRKHAARKD